MTTRRIRQEAEIYEAKLESKVRELTAQLGVLKSRLETDGAADAESLRAEIARVTEQRSATEKVLDELREVDAAGWDRLQSSLDAGRQRLLIELGRPANRLRRRRALAVGFG